jgi:uncharacterized protein (TIGR02246 family)
MRRISLAVLALAALVFLPLPAAADDGAKELDEAWSKAVKANDIARILVLYAEDAVVIMPDGAAHGARDVGRYYTDFLAKFTVKDVEFSDTRYETEDDLSTGWGRYRLTLVPRDGGAPVTHDGYFSVVARKHDGKWRYVLDHASAMLAPAVRAD